jgi:hypothetical protein
VGSQVLTSIAFLALLTQRLAPKEAAEAVRALRLEWVMGPHVVGLYDAEVREMMEEEAQVDLLAPVRAAPFAKLTAVTERIDPSPPCQGEDS